MMLDATQKYDAPLSKDRLFGWHAALFPSGWSNLSIPAKLTPIPGKLTPLAFRWFCFNDRV
jgi:hypothetical protein